MDKLVVSLFQLTMSELAAWKVLEVFLSFSKIVVRLPSRPNQ